MIDNQAKLFQNGSNAYGRRLEPYVEYIDFNSLNKNEFTFPIHLIAATLICLMMLAIFNIFVYDNGNTNQIVLGLFMAFSPFYFPAVYHYERFLSKEKHKSLEIDYKYRLMTYRDTQSGLHLHFSLDSIKSCTIHHTLLFPYGIDYASLTLDGGEEIICSSLLVCPWKLTEALDIPHVVKKKMINRYPD